MLPPIITFGTQAAFIYKQRAWPWGPSTRRAWPICLWPNGRRGDHTSLLEFMAMLNNNDRGIVLNFEVSTSKISFLDLEIISTEGNLSFKTFFKATDRNSFIPTNSCHHKSWIQAVPKGQFLRVRRNCSRVEDYMEQSEILIANFVDKGYARESLVVTRDAVGGVDRKTLLNDRPPAERDDGVPQMPFITGYSCQHWAIKKVVQKNWSLLLGDEVLGHILPEKPRVVYRGAKNLARSLVCTALDPPIRPNFFNDLVGFYKCGRCISCKTMGSLQSRRTVDITSTSTGKSFPIKSCITCNSTHVVYLIQCPCRLQYVGRTSRPLRVRFREHINNIRKGFPSHNLSKHYDLCHNRDPKGTTFIGFDLFSPHWRGSNSVREISKRETHWIYNLRSQVPFGLNVDLDINCFINNA